jgi:DNA-binding protein YbaB
MSPNTETDPPAEWTCISTKTLSVLKIWTKKDCKKRLNFNFMFNKLKQFKDLRDQAKKMQNALATESVTVERGGVKVAMNGNMEITSITINENLAKDSLEGILADCVNEAIKKVQKIMAEKMRQMGGIPGIS